MADIQQRHQLAMKQLTEQHTPHQSERDITQFKSQLATQQVSKRHAFIMKISCCDVDDIYIINPCCISSKYSHHRRLVMRMCTLHAFKMFHMSPMSPYATIQKSVLTYKVK